MASRDIPAAISARLAKDKQQIAYAANLGFDSGAVNVWTGTGDFTGSDSITYTGLGDFLSISNVEESKELSSTNLTISISGLNDKIIEYANTENYQNRPVTLNMFFFHPDTADEIEKVILFKGRIDTLTIMDGDSFSVIISCENKLIDLTKAKNLFFTPETQNFLHSGDKGLEFVPKIQEQSINWGGLVQVGGGGSADPFPIYELR
tara:strand:- start:3005 stop:3622 length:618 start_codon:yes stop_codon:yes gene_type:complete